MFLAVDANAQQPFFLTYPSWYASDVKPQKIITRNGDLVMAGSTNPGGSVYSSFILKADSTGAIQYGHTIVADSGVSTNLVDICYGYGFISNVNLIFVLENAIGSNSNVIIQKLTSDSLNNAGSEKMYPLPLSDSLQIGRTNLLPACIATETHNSIDHVFTTDGSPSSNARFYYLGHSISGLAMTKSDTLGLAVCRIDGQYLALVGFKFGHASTQWVKKISIGIETVEIDSTTDGGFILTGSTNTGNGYVLKISHDGSMNWIKEYAQTNIVKAVETLSGFVMIGNNTLDTSIFIMELDASSGQQLWTKKLELPYTVYAGGLVQTSNGLAFCGMIHWPGVNHPFMASCDSNGNGCYTVSNQVLSPMSVSYSDTALVLGGGGSSMGYGLQGVQVSLPTVGTDLCPLINSVSESSPKSTEAFPNPFTDGVNLGTGSYRVFDISGRELAFGHSHGFVDLSFLSDGIYFAQTKNSITKLVKTK